MAGCSGKWTASSLLVSEGERRRILPLSSAGKAPPLFMNLDIM